MRRHVICVLLCIGCITACDAKPAAPVETTKGPAPAGSSAAAEAADPVTSKMSVPARQWVQGVRRALPSALCESPYYKACFGLDKPECERRIAPHFESCLSDHADAVPNQPDVASGTAAGQLLGGCTGERFEAALVAAKQSVESPECGVERQKLLAATP